MSAICFRLFSGIQYLKLFIRKVGSTTGPYKVTSFGYDGLTLPILDDTHSIIMVFFVLCGNHTKVVATYQKPTFLISNYFILTLYQTPVRSPIRHLFIIKL